MSKSKDDWKIAEYDGLLTVIAGQRIAYSAELKALKEALGEVRAVIDTLLCESIDGLPIEYLDTGEVLAELMQLAELWGPESKLGIFEQSKAFKGDVSKYIYSA
tara:strand:- start:408 stop:719 length:312 start_codon:yes stop_codon:yes gene_type:complete